MANFKGQKIIRRNNSLQISHSIMKIKEHERRYTILLVIVFMFLFGFIGYHFFSVSNTVLMDNVTLAQTAIPDLSGYGQMVTLTKDDVMNNEEGLQSDSYIVTVQNHTTQDISYHILLVRDDFTASSCGCQDHTLPYHFIKYAVNFEGVHSLSDDSISVYDGIIGKNCSENIEVKMWVDSSFLFDRDYHFHGHFVIEKN